MRKISVDIFFCNRDQVKQAILEYLQDIKDYDGVVCPSLIMLGDKVITPNGESYNNLPIYRLFSIQRRQAWRECKIIVNLSSKAK